MNANALVVKNNFPTIAQNLAQDLQGAVWLNRKNRLKIAEILWDLKRKPYGYNEGDANFVQDEGVFPFYHYLGFESWSEFCNDTRYVSRMTAHKYIVCHEYWMIKKQVDLYRLVACPFERLYQLASMGFDDCLFGLAQAEILKGDDWDTWLAGEKMNPVLKKTTVVSGEIINIPTASFVGKGSEFFGECIPVKLLGSVQITLTPINTPAKVLAGEILNRVATVLKRLLGNLDQDDYNVIQQFLELVKDSTK